MMMFLLVSMYWCVSFWWVSRVVVMINGWVIVVLVIFLVEVVVFSWVRFRLVVFDYVVIWFVVLGS